MVLRSKEITKGEVKLLLHRNDHDGERDLGFEL
jgi:hypothetical protein